MPYFKLSSKFIQRIKLNIIERRYKNIENEHCFIANVWILQIIRILVNSENT